MANEKNAERKVLYGQQTKLNLENMSFSGERLSRFPEYISAAAKVKKACAMANDGAGFLPPEVAKNICSACDLLIGGEYNDQFPVDVFHGGGGIGINMNLNEVIASLAGGGTAPIDQVNLNQSTSDVCHSALHITIVNEIDRLIPILDDFAKTLRRKADDFTNITTIARTCWQDGLTASVGVLFSSCASALERNIGKIRALRNEFLKVNLGWTVIGTGSGADERYRKLVLGVLCRVTGLPLSWPEDKCDAAQYPDDIASLSSEIATTAAVLMKLSADLRLLSSGPETGLHELNLPAVQAGSSFFPGKVNPGVPEMMIQCGMLIEGDNAVVGRTVSMGEIHINLWEIMAGFLTLKNISMLGKAARLLNDRCLSGVTVNADVCERYAHSSIPTITAFKEKFGYQRISALVKEFGTQSAIEKLEQIEREEKGNE